MLGTIHDKWDKRESVHVNKGDKFVIIRGRRVEVKLEDNNHLRLSVVEKVDSREAQHHEAVLNLTNLLKNRRKDLAMLKQELKDMTSKLATEDLEEEVEDELYREVRAKRVIKKNHEKEISKLLAKTNIKVNYRIGRTGLTALLPPGLTLQPKFLQEPVCWCPQDMPASSLVEETTSMVEEMPLEIFTAAGSGLNFCIPNEEAKFAITCKGIDGKLVDARVDDFAVESKEVEIKPSVLNKKNGMWEVSYTAGDGDERFSLAVTHRNGHIQGSPFSVSLAPLLLEFSSAVNHTEDWLDDAVMKMSGISSARLWVQLHDLNGSEIYKSTGVTSGNWSQNHITAPGSLKNCDTSHSNAIILDNGDRMMIIGKDGTGQFEKLGYHMSSPHYRNAYNAYRSYNIIINKKQDSDWDPTRRMIIAVTAPNVSGWTALDNRISFSSSGFKANAGNWPKFRGTFRIYYKAL